MCGSFSGRSLSDTHVVHLEGLRERAWIRLAAASSPNRRVYHQVHWNFGNASRTSQGVERPEPLSILGVHGPNQRTSSPLETINHESSGRIERELLEVKSARFVVMDC